jgi:proteasome accessory factor C
MNVTQEVVSRCLALIPLIREHQGITLEELSRLSRIPRQQIADELGAVLLMCGVPPYFPHDYIAFSLDGDRVYIRFADHFRRPVSLNPLEALALKLACECVAPPGKAPPKAVANLLSKVEGAMSAEQRKQFRNLARRVAVREAPEPPSGIAARAALAVAERRVINLDYAAPGRSESRTREVHPYGLLARDGHWYLIGHDLSHERTLPFRADRIRGLEYCAERFEIPDGFRLEDYAHGPLVAAEEDRPLAVVRFRGASARWVRETAPGGSLVEVSDGVLWRQGIGNEAGLARFIIGFGGDAEVLEPRSLRQRVAEALRAVMDAHEEAPAGA